MDKMKIPKVEWDFCHTVTNGTQSDFCSFFFRTTNFELPGMANLKYEKG